MKEVYRLVRRVAPTDLPVLIVGETGTGKELVARALHELSGGSGKFVAVNAAAIPDTLFDSELFGHERGAFTEARSAKPGLVELANGGTFFLDELPSLPVFCQAKLLRVIEDRVVRRVGGLAMHPARARWVAAFQELADHTSIRADLLHRLAGMVIRLPSLSERRSDIPMLAEHFLGLAPGAQQPRLDPLGLKLLMEHKWPGNVRELRLVVHRAAALRRDGVINVDDVATALSALGNAQVPLVSLRRPTGSQLARLLKEHNGDTASAARALGIARSTLYEWLKKAALGPPTAPHSGRFRTFHGIGMESGKAGSMDLSR
jgi:DNA-binding NtrC family response regulator